MRVASAALAAGQPAKAVGACKSLIQHYPEFAPGMGIGAQVALSLNNANEALEFIDRALALEAKNAHFKVIRAQCLLALKQLSDAVAEVQKAPELAPEDALVLHNTATFLSMHCNEYLLACPYYERAVALSPGNADYRYNLAAIYRILGRTEDAESATDQALELKPDFYEAHLMRSGLRRQSEVKNHIQQLENLVDTGIKDWRGETMLCHALAKECEDIADYEASFRWLQRGTGLRWKHTRYDVGVDEETMDEIARHFSASFMHRAASDCDYDNGEAIFILGLPRSGSTLLERIISSHSDVHAAGELHNFALQLVRICKPHMESGKPFENEVIAASTRIDFSELGKAYVESTRPNTGQVPRFIDKLPFNFLYCGLIHLALPRARIIDIRRNPMDSCFAMYKCFFKNAYPMSYDLEQQGRYYLAYRKMMDHWGEVMPGSVLDVRYEELVADPEAQIRRILNYCELDWQDDCLHFEKNKAPTMTASATQVRERIYSSAVGAWRNYEEQLQPLRELLESGGIDVESELP
jgi:tetratricopeptide (TPR) repeat protein